MNKLSLQELEKKIEIEEQSSLFDFFAEYLDSCFRQGKRDKTDNINYFMNEYQIAIEDYNNVAIFYDKVKSNMYSGYGYHGGGRTKGDINRKKVSAYIEENAFEKLSIFAKKNNISPTKQVAKIIEDFVDKNL